MLHSFFFLTKFISKCKKRVQQNKIKHGKLYLFSDILVAGFQDLSISNDGKAPKFISYRIIGLCCMSEVKVHPANPRWLIVRANRSLSNLAEKEYVFDMSTPQIASEWHDLIKQASFEEKHKSKHSPLAEKVLSTDISPFLVWIIIGVLTFVSILTIILVFLGDVVQAYLRLTTPSLILIFSILTLIISIIIYYVI